MAKSKKDKASKKALSYGNLYTQEAVTQFLVNFGKQPDTDEVLRKAGIARHKLRVLLDDDEIAQATETRVDALLATPFRIEPSDTKEAEMLNLVLKEWFHEIATGAINWKTEFICPALTADSPLLSQIEGKKLATV